MCTVESYCDFYSNIKFVSLPSLLNSRSISLVNYNNAATRTRNKVSVCQGGGWWRWEYGVGSLKFTILNNVYVKLLITAINC